MSNASSLAYLEPFLVCGLCFGRMARTESTWHCPRGCCGPLDGHRLEEVLWQEMGRLLAHPKIRAVARRRLGNDLTDAEIKRLFHDLRQFVEFLPVEEKQRFATALVEKIEIISANTLKIHFRP
ncbi:MAG: hypothetical protein OZSIB_1330 [Candidatus Ozemobacter sibiricus]|jgi:hypothetical protein|uniref:Uncharacterized protein n=1 Tax=Candidatus Ozemobacter sibiricus TaxID=2268124 RepID=A0A367ZKJ4_9BACT|nr:MAG: hypothetical protein OZSIB_1330 [Candidatus Ozemobacter sibiricus]